MDPLEPAEWLLGVPRPHIENRCYRILVLKVELGSDPPRGPWGDSRGSTVIMEVCGPNACQTDRGVLEMKFENHCHLGPVLKPDPRGWLSTSTMMVIYILIIGSDSPGTEDSQMSSVPAGKSAPGMNLCPQSRLWISLGPVHYATALMWGQTNPAIQT